MFESHLPNLGYFVAPLTNFLQAILFWKKPFQWGSTSGNMEKER